MVALETASVFVSNLFSCVLLSRSRLIISGHFQQVIHSGKRMAASAVDPKVIATTRELLSGMIKKPALTDKLLNRPPFKFLHDVIVNVVKSSGNFADVFTPEELASENVTSKEAKVAFLQKCIDAIGESYIAFQLRGQYNNLHPNSASLTGKSLDVKPSKIVAGLEAEKTNLFLQALASAAMAPNGQSGQSSKSDGQQSKSDGQSSGQKKTPLKNGAKKSTQNGAKVVKKVSPKRKESPKEPTSNESIAKNESIGKNRLIAKDAPKEEHEETPLEPARKESTKVTAEETRRPDGLESIKSPKKSPKATTTRKARVVEQEEQKKARVVEQEEQKKARVVEQEEPVGNERPKTSGRPKTARAAPPRIKVEVEEAPSADTLASLVGGHSDGQFMAKPVAVITDAGEEEEEETAVHIQTDDGSRSGRTSALGGDIESGQFGPSDGDLLREGNSGQEKGSLVQKLIETKRDFEVGMGQDGNSDSVKPGYDDSLDSINIEKIRQSIESLAKLSVPVGRLFDYLHEDIDSMLNELRLWNEEVIKTESLKQEEETKERDQEERLKEELEQLENEINQEMEQISLTKGNIERNDEKLNKMMMTVVHR